MTTASLLSTSSGLILNETRIEGPIWLSENDISLIKTRISDAESRLQSPELQKPDSARQRDDELENITTLRNILSPIRRIPAETLSEIFEHACSDFPSVTRGACHLSSVCAAWRSSAHRTPSLWTRMVYNERWGSFDRQSERVRTWLGRSGGLPLRIEIEMWGRHTDALVDSCAQFFQCLRPFLPRVTSLNLFGRVQLCLPLLLLPPGSLSRLKSLFLYLRWPQGIEGDEQSWDPPRRLLVFLGSPFLKKVIIIEGDGLTGSLLETFALDEARSIKRLDLDIGGDYSLMNPNIHLLAIAKLTNLVTLRLTFCADQSHTPAQTETIFLLLPHLKLLQILSKGGTDAAYVLHVVRGLKAPRLKTLCLQLDDTWETSDLVEALRDFRDRSKVSLLRLELSGFEVYEDLHAIIDLFTSTIKTLRLSEMWFNPVPLLHALTHREGQDAFLPNLRDVQLQLIDFENELDDDDEDALRPGVTSTAVVDMIESRWWTNRQSKEPKKDGAKPVAPARLKKVLVDMDRLLFSEEAHRRAGVCKEQGLDLSIVNDKKSPVLHEDEWEEEVEGSQEES